MTNKILIAEIRPKYQYITPITFSQLVNYLLWQLANQKHSLFKVLLERFETDKPPFVASDAMPLGMVPRPHTPLPKLTNEKEKLIFLSYYRKPLKQIYWIEYQDLPLWQKENITLTELKKFIEKNLHKQSMYKSYTVTHNTINRISHIAQPFQYIHGNPHTMWMIFKIVDSDLWQNSELNLPGKIKEIFTLYGFGKRTNVGNGFFEFKLLTPQEFKDKKNIDINPNVFSISKEDIFMTLTDFTPCTPPKFKTKDLPDSQVFSYRIKIKHPRFAPNNVKNGIYFKPHVIKLEKGSVFTATQKLEYIGKTIDTSINDLPSKEISFGLPIKLKS